MAAAAVAVAADATMRRARPLDEDKKRERLAAQPTARRQTICRWTAEEGVSYLVKFGVRSAALGT